MPVLSLKDDAVDVPAIGHLFNSPIFKLIIVELARSLLSIRLTNFNSLWLGRAQLLSSILRSAGYRASYDLESFSRYGAPMLVWYISPRKATYDWKVTIRL